MKESFIRRMEWDFLLLCIKILDPKLMCITVSQIKISRASPLQLQPLVASHFNFIRKNLVNLAKDKVIIIY